MITYTVTVLHYSNSTFLAVSIAVAHDPAPGAQVGGAVRLAARAQPHAPHGRVQIRPLLLARPQHAPARARHLLARGRAAAAQPPDPRRVLGAADDSLRELGPGEPARAQAAEGVEARDAASAQGDLDLVHIALREHLHIVISVDLPDERAPQQGGVGHAQGGDAGATPVHVDAWGEGVSVGRPHGVPHVPRLQACIAQV
jgi:hypothetical protein